MRLLRLSLAFKYRILFGAAVVLIIGAALYVPWYMMEDLVLHQPAFREARRAADDYFRLVMGNPGAAGGGANHGGDSSLLASELSARPHFIPLTTEITDVEKLLQEEGVDPFVGRALRTFLTKPDSEYAYRSQRGEQGRTFLYAHALRVNKSCLACHGAGSVRPYVENQLAGVITVKSPMLHGAADLIWNRIWLIASGALAGVLAILVFYIITTRFILSPVHDLRRVAIHVAEGNLDERANVRTGDEFEQLSDSMNNMLERLRVSRDDLKRANRLLDEKLGQMAESNVALYEANRLKSEFLANVTHELRTPLTSIIGFAELLRESESVEQDARTTRYLEHILISGRILLEIINDLLDLGKIEAGKVELHMESIRIEEVCATLMEFVRPQVDKSKLHITLEVEENLPIVITDRGKVRQILFNLLSNAVKFTPEQGLIMLVVSRDGESRVRLSVTDTGPGISEEDQPIIFEKFSQVDQSVTREHAGTGLGLAIAKELTHILGGDIGVVSRPGEGATFWVSLPLVTAESVDREPTVLS